MAELNYAECLQAVYERNTTYDGRFVLAVHSTRIYCRPSCPARKPKPENISFYATCDEAEAQGYRACKRCEPQKRSFEVEAVEQVCRFIEVNLQGDIGLTLAELSAQVQLSPVHLHRIFKRVLGLTPHQYVEALRQQQFTQHLKTQDNVTSAIYEAGYGSTRQAYEQVTTRLGMTPAIYGRGGKGMTIHYTIVDSPLGRMLVAKTERGICGVSLGDSDSELRHFIKKEYPAADILYHNADLAGDVEQILAHLEGKQPHLDLPVDIQATAFQWQVLEALRDIPYGETRSYSELAESLGNPKGVRAVARACATNRVAIVIPCHRVIGKSGDLSGYRWGLERKKRLLETEKVNKA